MTLTRRRWLQQGALLAAPAWTARAARATPATETPLGWAAVGATTSGTGARPEHVIDIHDRAGLDAALALGDTPKILRLHRRIDLCTDAQGRRVEAEHFRDPAYDEAAFDRAYDPATWGRADPAGPLEDARRRSQRRQAERVVVRVPSNTTLIGVAPDAGFERGMVLLERVANVVLHDLSFSDAYDHFPEWQPRDNGHGEWNSEYDTLSLRYAERVWVNHCRFDDGRRPDHLEPSRLGYRVQHHDGLLDITRESDLVTVSWSRFAQHDKTLLIGAGDGQAADAGHLRVTLHHNHFHGCHERTPRVRFGRVHVVANLFSADRAEDFAYSLGVGQGSRLVSEHNRWELPEGIPADRLLRRLKGQVFSDRGSRLNGRPVDLLQAWQARHPDEALSADVGWRPADHYDVAALQPADPDALALEVRMTAGPRRR
ncbi:MAG: pectate lyase [Roseateles depolymerans]|uniref:Pectate lyase n=1 Tax=Roseateles depolymerans TaxID=76731 RepID=A0A2W5E0K3_9BURK|nr:MAG: pectate lyase [Roseateles depolymerans]